jgi:hypothetical protein
VRLLSAPGRLPVLVLCTRYIPVHVLYAVGVLYSYLVPSVLISSYIKYNVFKVQY